MPIHDPIFNEMKYLLENTGKTGFEADDEFKSLNDAAKRQRELASGSTEVWFMRPQFFSQFISGTHSPTIKDLKRTHVLLGKVKETNPDKLYRALQGHLWSPKGEARALILSKGLQHTSMSVGDVFKIGSKHYVVAHSGFAELNE